MKLARLFVLCLSILLAGCDAYYQAEEAKADATAAPYDAQARAAEAQRDVELAQLDAQIQLAGIQATAQAEQVDRLVTQTSRSLSILEDASTRQVDLVEAQYRSMQLNALVLVIAGALVLAAVLILVIVLMRRRPVMIVALPAQPPAAHLLSEPIDGSQPLTIVHPSDHLPVMRPRRRQDGGR